MSLANKIALVTGAGTGIGQGIALGLAHAGAQVAVNYFVEPERAEETVRQIHEVGGQAFSVQADVSQPDQVFDMVGRVTEHFGGIDILVNNAAQQPNLGLLEYDEQTYDRVMNTNCMGYWLTMQAILPTMRARGKGRVVNISSVHGKRPTDFDVVYAMSKGGVKMLTREAAIELARYHITVNMIEPGAVAVGPKSGNPRPIVPPEARSEHRLRTRSKFPLGRVGRPEDIANVVSFLASDQSEFITGASIRADGGSMLL